MRTRCLALVVFLSTCALAPLASGATTDADPSGDPSPTAALEGCTKFPEVSPGIHRQTFDSTDVTGGIAAIPGRVVTQAQPGDQTRICVGFQNRTGGPIVLEFAASDVGADPAGIPTTAEADNAKYGAALWFDIPDPDRATLRHGDLVWLDVGIDVPTDTAGGSSYAAVVAKPVDDAPDEAQTKIAPSVVTQVFLDIPTDDRRGGKVTKVDVPKVIWWDGLGIADIPGLEKLRGQEIAPIRFTWENTGSFTEDVGGRVRIESALGGKDVTALDLKPAAVLRDSRRRFAVTWEDDIPLLGKFTPVLRVQTESGETEEVKLDSIWVIPAWWYVVLFLLAIGLPLWWRRRSRRRYDELLARVEAAESRATGETEWEDDDEWNEGR